MKALICHGPPDRTCRIGKWYLPVCARCTGLYIGAFSYFTLVYFFYVQYTTPMILLAVAMVIPTFLDGATQFFGFRESNNFLRFTTGLIAGFGLGIPVKALKLILMS